MGRGSIQCKFKQLNMTGRHKRGFTLLEMMLSVALIGILMGVSIPVFLSFQTRSDMDVAANIIAQSLHRAQILAQASDGDSSWGVKVSSSTITLFKGVGYFSRDTTVDELFDISSAITATGTTEVVFAKFTGLPAAVGSINLSASGQARVVTINSRGLVNY